MSSPLFRAAIIGCGPFNQTRGGSNSVSYAHARALGKNANVLLVAAASRSRKNTDDFCAEFPGTKPYLDYREMLATERPDWVSICAFPPDREAMALAAMQAGCKILLIEKPLAVTRTAMQRILEESRCRGVLVAVNHQRRYGKWFEWFREQIQSETCGALRALTLYHEGRGFVNFGPHLLDAALFALEPRQPRSVLGTVDWTESGDYQGVRTERSFLADVCFPDGVHLTMHSGPGVGEGQPCLRAICAEGLVELYLRPFGPTAAIGRTLGKIEASPDFGTEHFHHNDSNPNMFYDRAIQDIWRCYKEKTPCRVDVVHAAIGTKILLSLFEAGGENQTNLTLLPIFSSIS